MMHRLVLSVILTALITGFNSPADARVARSVDYELEYASVNAGSESTTSAGYSIVSTITTDGVAGENASSASYSIEPAVGSGSAPTTAVSDWMLY